MGTAKPLAALATARYRSQMVDVPSLQDIQDADTLKAWLLCRPHTTSVLLAVRAALRAAMVGFPSGEYQKSQNTKLLLTSLRSLSAPWVASRYDVEPRKIPYSYTLFATTTFEDQPNPAIAARAAASAAAAAMDASDIVLNDEVKTSVTENAVEALTGAFSFDFIRRALSQEIRYDMERTANISEPNDPAIAVLAAEKLWRHADPKTFRVWNEFCSDLRTRDEDWEVWIDWFTARCDPARLPSIEALELERVSIPSEEWKKGAKHVNGMIKAMVEYHKLPTARRAAVDGQTGFIGRDPALRLRDIENAGTLDDLVAGMKDDMLDLIEWFREERNWNQYASLDRQFTSLERALGTLPVKEDRLHSSFVRMLRAIDQRQANNNLPPSEEIDDLVRDVEEGALKLRVLFPALQTVHEGTQRLRAAEATQADKDTFNQMAEIVREVVEAEFADDLAEDVEMIEISDGDIAESRALAEINKETLQRIIGYFRQIRNVLEEPLERLLKRVDQSLPEAVARVERYEKVAKKLAAVWDGIKNLINGLIG